MEIFQPVAESYAAFALEAVDSPCFRAWSEGVVDDPEVQALIATLPEIKQQANLVFAAARWHGVPAPGPYAGLRAALLGRLGADPGHRAGPRDPDQRGGPAGHPGRRCSPGWTGRCP